MSPQRFAAVLLFATVSACAKPDNASPDASPLPSARPSAPISGSAGAVTATGCDVTLDSARGEVSVEDGKRYCFANATFSSNTLPEDVENLSALGSCKRTDAIGATTLTCGKLRLQFGGPRPWLLTLQVQ